jgi:hypothetical protein
MVGTFLPKQAARLELAVRAVLVVTQGWDSRLPEGSKDGPGAGPSPLAPVHSADLA